MANKKKNPRYNVISIRVSDEEKAVLDAVTRNGRTSISKLMREAIRLYTPLVETAVNQG
jgi:predicted transcriptional regulator